MKIRIGYKRTQKSYSLVKEDYTFKLRTNCIYKNGFDIRKNN